MQTHEESTNIHLLKQKKNILIESSHFHTHTHGCNHLGGYHRCRIIFFFLCQLIAMQVVQNVTITAESRGYTSHEL